MFVKGENGTVQVSSDGVGSPGLALFNKLIRSASSEELSPLVDAYIAEIMDADAEKQEELIADLFVLVFQTRDILKGKGERDLFYELLLLLNQRFPKTVLGLLRFIPDFGYWKDILKIVSLIDKRINDGIYVKEKYIDLRNALLDLYAHELKLAQENKKPTLSGKWAPREGSMYNNLALEIAERVFPEQTGTYRLRSYRRLISGMTKVVEQLMSRRQFSKIEFEHVPSKAMQKYKKAFITVPDENNEDRKTCKENFDRFLLDCAEGKQKMKTNTLLPHELAAEALKYVNQTRWGDANDNNTQTAKKLLEVLNIQWDGIKDKFVDDIVKECEATKDEVIDLLSHSIALSDVSGSMSGIPMDVSIGMGLLIAEYCKAFPDTLITFESKPGMFTVTGENLGERVSQIAGMPWGGSTDFLAALRLLLQTAQMKGIHPDDFPKIMFVFSDMQFDEAEYIIDGQGENGNNQCANKRELYSSSHRKLMNDFKESGYEIPLIIYWNLRSSTLGHETSAEVEGTVMLSGYNPTLLKSVFGGQDLSKIDFEKFKKEINPQKVYMNVVQSPNYTKIREAIKEMKSVWLEELFK